MSGEEVIGRLKVHEDRLLGYEDKEEDEDDSSFSGTSERGSHNKEKKRSWTWW